MRCILYKFHHFGRTITDRKKFEEGVFLDLRNLRVGTDAILENPKLELLDFLHKNQCIRTQKKQKVFFWFNVAHDKLMADALERDIKRERSNQSTVSVALREPALSFNYDAHSSKSIETQLAEHLALPRFRPTSINTPNSAASSKVPEKAKYAKVGGRPNTPVEDRPYKRAPESDPEEQTFVKKSRHLITEDDFPLDYLAREVPYPPNSLELFPQDSFYAPFYGPSPGYFNQAGLAPFLESPINIVKNDDYILEQTPLPRFSALPIQMFIPRLASEGQSSFPMLPPLSAIPGIWSSYGSHFPLLATDNRPTIEDQQALTASAFVMPNSFEQFYQNPTSNKASAVDYIAEKSEKDNLNNASSAGDEAFAKGKESDNKIPTPDSTKQTSEV